MQTETAVPWRVRDAFFALAAIVAGDLALNGLLVLLDRADIFSVRQDREFLTATLVVQEVILVAAVWFFVAARYRATRAQLGLRAFDLPLGCGLSFVLWLASYVIRFCYVAAAFALGYRIGAQSVVNALSTTGIGLLVTFVVAGVVAPIAEEVFFRGVLYGGLRARIGSAPALLVSAVVFTALHLSLELFVPIFVLGIFLAYLYQKTGSLYPGILLHSANNVVAVIALVVLQALGIQIA